MPLQKADCKHQIDVIDVVGPLTREKLRAACDASDGPCRKARKNVAFGVGEIIHRRNSNIASTGATRRARENLTGKLDFICTLYSFFGVLSIL